MSDQPVLLAPHATAEVPAQARSFLRPLATAALALVVVGNVLSLLLTGFTPNGDPSNGFAFQEVAGHPGRFWAFTAFGGIGQALLTTGTAFAVCLLVRARGSVLARVGAVLSVLSGALLSAGLAAIAVLYGYAADPAVLDPAAGRAFVDHANDHTWRFTALVVPGALCGIVAMLLIAVALWRGRAVPRWIPVVFLVGTLAGFVISSGLAGVLVALPAAAAMVLIAWYALLATRATAQVPPAA
ncbi:hypothetical protein ACFWVC_11725 [Streptomyces sp. NPDC058691]|uniref:hypothetical protein n=1 Tax=Streptomyces sp. NPDC058691 TaxID=3346601 RepID=UPI00364F5C9D